MGASRTVSDRFRAWARAGVFERLWRAGLLVDDAQVGIAWEWQAMDGAMTNAPLGGGKGTGPNPTDRGKRGVTRSRLTEGRGIPLAVAMDGANRHDRTLVEPTLQAMVMERPPPTAAQPQHLCLDKGYDDDVRALVTAWGDTAHIRTRGEETASKERIPGYRARRWVVERTHSWLNRLRRLVIRWEKKVEHYLAMLHFACAWITFRAAGVFG